MNKTQIRFLLNDVKYLGSHCIVWKGYDSFFYDSVQDVLTDGIIESNHVFSITSTKELFSDEFLVQIYID